MDTGTGITFDFMLFAVNLMPFLLGIYALLKSETNIAASTLDWGLAVVSGLVAVLCMQPVQQWLAGYAQAETIVRMILTFVGVILTMKGYMGARSTKFSDKALDMGARYATAVKPSWFFRKY